MNNCLGNDHDIEGFGCNVHWKIMLHEDIEVVRQRLEIESANRCFFALPISEITTLNIRAGSVSKFSGFGFLRK